MKRIWAPWRVPYITQIIKKEKGCIFCKLGKSKKDKNNLIFIRTEHCFAVLNLYPYNNGHTLVVPNRHVKDLSKLRSDETTDLFALLNYTKSLLDAVMHPDGYNIGMNIGRAAGAGVPGHIHIHIVPRWSGDANFMPVVSNTKVISQSLKALHTMLCREHKRKNAKR
ncbi:MAG: HIT domain-containing protein [Candidatus Omnitrophica bacterium]|nr:HIT domain-containing protein [Candidatus Omnitrophota bacterium]